MHTAEKICEHLEKVDAVSRPARFNHNKLIAVLCMAASAAISVSLIWLAIR
jgi:hypothetical protein